MKKILLCGALLCCTAGIAGAQGVSLRINQLMMNTISVTPNIPGMSADADLKANIFSADLAGSFAAFQNKPGNLLRVGVGYSSMSLNGKTHATYGSSQEYDKGTASAKQSNIRIAPGISTGLTSSERFGFYAGMDLPVSVIGSTTFESQGESQSFDVNDSLQLETFGVEGKMSGGFSVGLSPFLGFSYNELGPFSIGTEVATGLQYAMMGPAADVKYYEDGVFQATETTEVKVSSFSKIPMRVSLVLTYRFGSGNTE